MTQKTWAQILWVVIPVLSLIGTRLALRGRPGNTRPPPDRDQPATEKKQKVHKP